MSIDASTVFPWESILEYLNSSTQSILSLILDQTQQTLAKGGEHILNLNISDDLKEKITTHNTIPVSLEKELTENLYELYLYKMSSSIYLWLREMREQILSSTKKDLTDLFTQLKELELDMYAVWNVKKILWIK